jgi:hypothetical protein
MPRASGAVCLILLACACGGGNHQTLLGEPCSGTGDCNVGLLCDPVYMTSGASVCGDVLDKICSLPCKMDSDCAAAAPDGGVSTCIEECAGAPLRCING